MKKNSLYESGWFEKKWSKKTRNYGCGQGKIEYERFCNMPSLPSNVDVYFCGPGIFSPLANSFIDKKREKLCEKYYPLHAYVCDRCYPVQLEKSEATENIIRRFRSIL